MSGGRRLFRLAQVDSWFFRDGRPMHIGESSLRAVESVFPPAATTVAGALRLALARANGWSGTGRWSKNAEMAEVLGKEQDLGRISFSGPFLMRETPLFPMPLHVLGAEDGGRWIPRAMLAPGEPVDCDLGEAVRLPAVPRFCQSAGLRNGSGSWITLGGMQDILAGKLPAVDDVVASDSLWRVESRTGIRRDWETRTTKDNALFSTMHVRLAPNVSMVAGIDGLPEGWKSPQGLVPLGGEGRLAELESAHWDMPRHGLPSRATGAVGVLLTHADLSGQPLLPGMPLPGFERGRVVSVCSEKAVRQGGWSSGAHAPLEVRSLLPAGSVVHVRFDAALDPADLPERMSIGLRGEYGFGHMVLGLWNDEGETR